MNRLLIKKLKYISSDSEFLLTMLNGLIDELYLRKLAEESFKNTVIDLSNEVEQLKNVNYSIMKYLSELKKNSFNHHSQRILKMKSLIKKLIKKH